MNTPGLFIVGVVVTLIVVGAIAALVYAAILDGRDPGGQADFEGSRDPGLRPSAGPPAPG